MPGHKAGAEIHVTPDWSDSIDCDRMSHDVKYASSQDVPLQGGQTRSRVVAVHPCAERCMLAFKGVPPESQQEARTHTRGVGL